MLLRSRMCSGIKWHTQTSSVNLRRWDNKTGGEYYTCDDKRNLKHQIFSFFTYNIHIPVLQSFWAETTKFITINQQSRISMKCSCSHVIRTLTDEVSFPSVCSFITRCHRWDVSGSYDADDRWTTTSRQTDVDSDKFVLQMWEEKLFMSKGVFRFLLCVLCYLKITF